jgi:peptidyl-tRNA hydrolase
MEQFLEQDLQNLLARGSGHLQEHVPGEIAAADDPADELLLSSYRQLDAQLQQRQKQQQDEALAFADTFYNQSRLPSEFYDASEGGADCTEEYSSAPASPEAAIAAAAAAAALLATTPRLPAGRLMPVAATTSAGVAAFMSAVEPAAVAIASEAAGVTPVPSSLGRPAGSDTEEVAVFAAAEGASEKIDVEPEAESATATLAPISAPAVAAAEAGDVQQGMLGSPETVATASGSTVPSFPVEDDEAIAKQKVAAQKKLAALEAAAAAAAEGADNALGGKVIAEEEEEEGEEQEMASSSKAQGLPTHKDLASSAGNSGAVVMDPGQVPTRPKPWHTGQAAAQRYANLAPNAKEVRL